MSMILGTKKLGKSTGPEPCQERCKNITETAQQRKTDSMRSIIQKNKLFLWFVCSRKYSARERRKIFRGK
jgi:hypothetical protein